MEVGALSKRAGSAGCAYWAGMLLPIVHCIG